MADMRQFWTLTSLIFCCLLPSLHGDGHPGYVPIRPNGVGVPLTPSFSTAAAADVSAVVEESEMIETAAGDLESEASLEEWEDETQDDGEQRVATYITPITTSSDDTTTSTQTPGVTKAVTYADVMLGRATRHSGHVIHPGDIGLTLIPTGGSTNRTAEKTMNGTAEKTRKILCIGRNVTELNETATVLLVNNTRLLGMLGLKNDSSTPNCAIVMFYAPWCPFCAKAAPHYNALARAFPQMNVLAIDAAHFSNLNARFGTVAVPNILIFHNAKAVARFNATMRTLESMGQFVTNITGLKPQPNVSVEVWDEEGPLSSTPTTEPDYLLVLSWAFNIFFFLYVFANSSMGQRLYHSVATFGREPEHQHID